MAIIRHGQRAITAVSPARNQGKWINPNKSRIFAPDFPQSQQDIFFDFDGGSWRTIGLQDIDTSGQYRVQVACRPDVIAGTQYMCAIRDSGVFRRLGLNASGNLFWQSDGTSRTFLGITLVVGQWYGIEVFADGTTLVARAINLLTNAEQRDDTQLQVAGSLLAACGQRVGDAAVSSAPFNGPVGQFRYFEGEDEVLKVDFKVDEGFGTTILDKATGLQSQTISAPPGGVWVPANITEDWTGWNENPAWTAGNTHEVITTDQFRLETGASPPPSHAGPVLKIVITNELSDETFRIILAGSRDLSAQTGLCWRFYVSQNDFLKYKVGGRVSFKYTDTSFVSVETQSAAPNASKTAQSGMNSLLYDINDETWFNGSGAWGVLIGGGFDPALVDQYQIRIATPSEVNGFESPFTAYIFDAIEDPANNDPDPIRVCIAWDDSNDSDILVVDPLAVTHSLKQNSMHLSGAIDSGGSLTSAQVQTLKASGRWEFHNHSVTHADYEALDAAGVDLEIAGCDQDMIARDIRSGGSSRPLNAFEFTTDGVWIPQIENGNALSYSRRGKQGLYIRKMGAHDPMQIGTLPALGQGANDFISNYAEWLVYHSKAKQIGFSYLLYGHRVVAGAPSGPNEIEDAQLNLIFADLASDVTGGVVEDVFFSEFTARLGFTKSRDGF